jgi:AbrB family looped-hinge helix DNA binding protein
MKDLRVKVTTGGRITIPVSIRKKLGIKGGTRIKFLINEKDNKIILAPHTKE